MRPLKIFFGRQSAHRPGLEDWFADKVVSDDKIVEFHWGKTEQRNAEIIAIRAFSFIRFRWLDDDNERDYFEIKDDL